MPLSAEMPAPVRTVTERALRRRASKAGGLPRPGRPALLACGLQLKRLVEGLEECGSLRDPILVTGVGAGYAVDETLESRRFGARGLPVPEVDIVHHLGQRPEARVIKREARDQCLEGAAIGFVGVFRFEHVEPYLARFGLVRPVIDEPEPCVGIDEPADEPGAGDPVDMHASARNPGPAGPGVGRATSGRAPAGALGCADPRLQSIQRGLGDLPGRRAEEVDRPNLPQTATEAGNCPLELRAGWTIDGSAGSGAAQEPVGFLRHGGVVGVPCRPEKRLDLPVGQPGDERRFTNRGLSPAILDLPQDPLEVLGRLLGPRKHVHRVLDRDCPDSLQAAPDLHAKVVGLGRKLVDEQEPAAPGGRAGAHDQPRTLIPTAIDSHGMPGPAWQVFAAPGPPATSWPTAPVAGSKKCSPAASWAMRATSDSVK